MLVLSAVQLRLRSRKKDAGRLRQAKAVNRRAPALVGDMKLLSIVVPVCNEEPNIAPLYEAVNAALQPIADRYNLEFIFTDNCSTDGTFDRLEVLAHRDPRVRAYRLARNFGFQRSILTGYRLARGQAAVQIDCDLQDPPELILEFVKQWEAGCSIVYGVRRSRDEPIQMQAMRRLFYRWIAWLSGDELPHDAGDFRLVDRAVLDLLHSYNDESPYLRGYISSLGYKQLGVPYDRAQRVRGKSAFGIGALTNLAIDGIVSHSIFPLRLASFVGISLSILATFAVGIYVLLWMTGDQSWPAGFATLAILLLISLALNATFLGIIGEYLARIYRQLKPGPLAIVERYVDHGATADSDAPVPSTRTVAGIILPVTPTKSASGPKGGDDGI
jgi:glycosyltransferase involved in cell wall biosynthesis